MRSRLGNWVALRKLPCFDTVFPLVLHDAVDWRGNKVISDEMVIHQLDCLLVIPVRWSVSDAMQDRRYWISKVPDPGTIL